jgi:hypothetical protein
MPHKDDKYVRLFEAAVAARRHNIAIDIASAVRGTRAGDGPTQGERDALRDADVACKVAEEALINYRSPPPPWGSGLSPPPQIKA